MCFFFSNWIMLFLGQKNLLWPFFEADFIESNFVCIVHDDK